MANRIDDETIEYVGILAKLKLSDQEKEQAKQDMERMLNYIDRLNELDTEGIEPMSHLFPVQNVFREDEVANGDGSKDTLQNAPGQKNSMIQGSYDGIGRKAGFKKSGRRKVQRVAGKAFCVPLCVHCEARCFEE